ncbi:hypothetical protein Aros01_08890 [Streptosporangium roseum]
MGPRVRSRSAESPGPAREEAGRKPDGARRAPAPGPTGRYCTVILSTSIVMPFTCGVDVPVVTDPLPALTPLTFIV